MGLNKIGPLDSETFDFKDMIIAMVIAVNAKGVLRFLASLLPFMRDWVDSLDEISAINLASNVNNRRAIRGKEERIEIVKTLKQNN